MENNAWNVQDPYETALELTKRYGLSMLPLGADKSTIVIDVIHKDDEEDILCHLKWEINQIKPMPDYIMKALHTRYKPPIWAMVTGKVSGIITLDFDGAKGIATLERLGIDPHRRTGSDGAHADFVHPGWYVQTLNCVSSKDKPWATEYPGLDLKGDGGYVAVAGKNGKGPYTWVAPFGPYSLDLLPDDLREMLGLLHPPVDIEKRDINRVVETIYEEDMTPTAVLLERACDEIAEYGRNTAGFRLACQIRDAGYDMDTAEEVLREFVANCPSTNTKGDNESYTTAQAFSSVQQVYSRGPREPWENSSGSGSGYIQEDPGDAFEDDDDQADEDIRREESNNPTIEATTTTSAMPPLPEHVRLTGSRLPIGEEWVRSGYIWDSAELRKVSPCLAEYLTHSLQVSPEGHPDMHVATGIWTFSTAAGGRVYTPLGTRFYTPVSTLLVARTSLFAKSTTAYVGKRVLKAAKLSFLLGADSTTPQKLLANMSGKVPLNYDEMLPGVQQEIKDRLSMAGQVGWYYDEVNQLLDAMTKPGSPMAEFTGLLRVLDNCPPTYVYETRSHGREEIERPYLAFLGSTTVANISHHARRGSDFWNDGFWARNGFITPPTIEWKTDTMPRREIPIPESLTEALKEWHSRLGIPTCYLDEIMIKGQPSGRYNVIRMNFKEHAVSMDNDADAAYVRYREALRSMIGSSVNYDLDGSYTRLSDRAIRIAVLLASIENRPCIDIDIWSLAQEITEMFRRNLHELYSQAGTSQQNEAAEEVLLVDFIKKKGSTTVRDIVRSGPNDLRHLKSDGVRKLIKLLAEGGIIERDRERKRGEWWRLAH